MKSGLLLLVLMMGPIAPIEEQTRLEDENGNVCTVEYWGSLNAAQKALDSLENCKNCLNCYKCRDCKYCEECINTYDSYTCKRNYFCHNNWGSYDCSHSRDLWCCKKMASCSNCAWCEGLINTINSKRGITLYSTEAKARYTKYKKEAIRKLNE